jgi:hypothetical protein
VLFVVWAYVPDATLEAYGFTYFPSKHWAVAVPAMIVVTYVFSLVVYKAVDPRARILRHHPGHAHGAASSGHDVL